MNLRREAGGGGGINEHCDEGVLTRSGDDSNGRRCFTGQPGTRGRIGRIGRASRREDEGGGAGERTERERRREGGKRGRKDRGATCL
jgi:hypothetical protein